MTSRLSDPINPDYYKRNGLEAIDVIEAFFMHSPHLANAFKYMVRMGEKPGNSLVQDADKAKWYIDRWVGHVEGQRDSKRDAALAAVEERRRRNIELAEQMKRAAVSTEMNLQQMKEDTEW